MRAFVADSGVYIRIFTEDLYVSDCTCYICKYNYVAAEFVCLPLLDVELLQT